MENIVATALLQIFHMKHVMMEAPVITLDAARYVRQKQQEQSHVPTETSTSDQRAHRQVHRHLQDLLILVSNV